MNVLLALGMAAVVAVPLVMCWRLAIEIYREYGYDREDWRYIALLAVSTILAIIVVLGIAFA